MAGDSKEKHPNIFAGNLSFSESCESFKDEYGEILNSMPDGIIITNTTGHIVAVNTQTEKLFGYQREDLISEIIEILLPADLRQKHLDQRKTYTETPYSRPMGQGMQLLGLRQDGTEFPVEISLSPMLLNGETLICAAVRDVTKRIAVKDALRASEEQVRLLLDSTVEAIYGLDLEGNCTFCNRACMTTLGYHHTEELLGKNMHDLIHHTRPDGTDYPIHECRIYEAFRLGEGTHVDDEVFWKADGNSFPAEYRSFPVRRDGDLIGSVVTFLDITEQKRVADALRTQQEELTHASRLTTMGEMAAGLAHELNQPLTAMSAFAEGALARLDRGKLSNEDIASVFSRIAENAQRGGDIIKRLRNFVQKRKPHPVLININHLVHDVYQFVESDTKQQNISIIMELANNISQVKADPVELQQVLINLIRNSCDALSLIDSDNRTILISSNERTAGRIQVVVEDSGAGVSHNVAERVFEPFYTSKAEGLGIGLSICQNIVESHGGNIGLNHSRLGGASVHFDLPSYQQEIKSNES
jgi:two-component system, LuxR family, sensor kinase FixL